MDFVEVSGTALSYELCGSGANIVVLIHEMGGSLETWDLVAPQLAAARRVLGYDRCGAGLSEKLRGELTIDLAADRRSAVLARTEREGQRLDSGYPVQLRGDAQRFATVRARWLGGDRASFAAVYRTPFRITFDERSGARSLPGAGRRQNARRHPPAPGLRRWHARLALPATCCCRRIARRDKRWKF
jgi:hypothetical protein